MTQRKAKIEFYRDRKDMHRWRMVSPNGNIIAASTEGYRHKRGARANWDSVRRYITNGHYVEIGR